MTLPLRPRQLVCLLLALLAGGCLVYLCYATGYNRARDQLSRGVLAATTAEAERIEQQLTETIRGLSELAARLEASPAPPDELLGLLAAALPGQRPTSIYLLDVQGNILAEYPAGSLAGKGIPPHLLKPPAENPSGLQLLSTRLAPLLQVTRQIRRPNQPPLQLGALLPLSELLWTSLPADVRQERRQFLLDATGHLLLHPDRSLDGAKFSSLVSSDLRSQAYTMFDQLRSQQQGSFWVANSLRGQLSNGLNEGDLLFSFAPVRLPGTLWGLVRVRILPDLAQTKRFRGAAGVLLVLSALGLILLRYRRRQDNRAVATDIQTLQQRLVQAELRNRQILDHAGDALFYIDPETGGIIDQNQATLLLLGYDAAELKALPLSELFPGSERRRYLKLMKRVIKHGYGEETGLQLRCKDGQVFIGSIHARLGHLGQNQVVHGVLRDISDLKRIETELRQRNQELSLVNLVAEHASSGDSLQQILDAIRSLVIDAFGVDGGGIYLSRHAGTLLELVSHQGIDDQTRKELGSLPRGQGLVGRVLAGGRPASSSNLPRDRRLWSRRVIDAGWLSLQVIPLASREETVGVLFLFSRDKRVFNRDEVRLLLAIGQQIGNAATGLKLLEELAWQNRLTLASNRELQTSRQQLTENLRQQKEVTRTLQRLEEMKNNFLALASHELRTPLTYILSGSQLLLEQSGELLSAPHQRILQAVYDGGKRLEEIVDNLLEMARLEAQSIYLGKQRIDLALLLSQVRGPFEATLGERRLQLIIDPPAPVDTLYGDHDHLLKSLHRLVENAIKFTPPEGQIRISCQCLDDAQILAQKSELERFNSRFFHKALGPAYLQLSVSDTGIGIDSEEQTRIFDKFYEVGDIGGHFTSRTGFGGKGVGLGLALVRSMIEAHAGMIWVSSPGTVQGGSSFHLLLPLTGTLVAVSTEIELVEA